MSQDPFKVVTKFENQIADFFNAPYAVAVDSCTHGIELCLRYTKPNTLQIPTRTYLSIAMLSNKLNIPFIWEPAPWEDYYYITPNIIDAAVLWKADSYIPGTMMCLSFQYQKHLKLGRGGMILLDDRIARDSLVKMSYDGRERGIPWRDQNINMFGYHYYMTPEVAQDGLNKLEEAKTSTPKKWEWTDWPNLREMDIFNE